MKSFSLNAKLAIVFSVFVLALVANSIIAIQNAKQSNDTLDLVTYRLVTLERVVSVFKSEVHAWKDLLIRGKDPANFAKYTQEMSEFEGETIVYSKALSQKLSGKEAELLNEFLAQEETLSQNYNEARERYLKPKAFNLEAADNFVNGKDRPAMNILNQIADLLQEESKQESIHAKEAATRGRNILLSVSIFSILFCLGLAFIILKKLSGAMNQVISNLEDNSNQVTSAAQQIASSSEELSKTAAGQAASLAMTSASIEEMSSMIKRNSDNANKAAEVSSNTHDSANKGKEVVGEMLKAIDEINESNNQISEVVKVIAEIENKTKVINDIVFKTQLLSFNASVEAARAGAHGKGFAVVAEEVGKLAELSGNAARQISDMLSASAQKVGGLVTTAKEKVKVGTEVSKQCGTVLEEIVSNVGTLSQMAKDIASASQEQASGVDDISKAIGQLDQVTQENAASSEESASAAKELSVQAESLKDVVLDLFLAIKGGDDQQNSTRDSAAYAANKTHSNVHHITNVNNKKENDVGSATEKDPQFKNVS